MGMRRSTLLALLVIAIMALTGALATPASAEEAAYAPTIASDLPDYAPGGHVVLTGTGWQPGETVAINVADATGIAWVHEGMAIADGADVPTAGAIRYEFDLPLAYAPLYVVEATGLGSGAVATTTFTDAVGAYSIKWSAADPAADRGSYAPTYKKVRPSSLGYPAGFPKIGRLSDPMKDAVAYGPSYLSSNYDAVQSLMPKDLALGQIVPFEMEIKVSGDTTPENGTIKVDPYWLTLTTNGGDFGFDPAYKVIAAFVDYGDVGTIDPLGNATVSALSSGVSGTGNNVQIDGDITVSGLDDGDNVIVEIWVVLKSSIAAGVTGNVQTGLTSATIAAPADYEGRTDISIGNQTVPLLQSSDFITNDVDVSVTKSDLPDSATLGGSLVYTITVTNNDV
jgi:hypothetical protein